MMEIPANSPDTFVEKELSKETIERGIKVLSNLGFNTESFAELVGKRVLDIGSGAAEAVQVFRKHGIDATPLDADDSFRGVIPGYIVADATKEIPFSDNTFEITMAYANPIFDTESIEAYSEALRVTKEGGQLRIGPFFLPVRKTRT
tara:strand:+ start:2902 stop:3342 length:441 start_codon:yes stop_codon:yes gene_type:complete